MQREGAHVIASSKEYPGAIPDLLAVSGDLIKNVLRMFRRSLIPGGMCANYGCQPGKIGADHG